MVEADRLPPSISDICQVCEHIDIIDMLSIGLNSLSINSWGYVQCFKHWSIVWSVVEWSNRNQY